MKAFGAVKTKPTILPNAVDQAPPAPPGHKRREQKAKRQDQLQEQAETVSTAADMEAVDVNKIDEDLEILSRIDGLKVSNQKADRAYCWVQASYPKDNPGLEIMKKKIEGWKMVKGDPDEGGDPESWEHAGPDGLRRIGDCVLMWMPKSRKQMLDDQRELKQMNVQGREIDSLKAEVEKNTAGAAKLVTVGEMSKAQLDRLQRIATARKMAGDQVNRMVREGTMPGTRLNSGNAVTR